MTRSSNQLTILSVAGPGDEPYVRANIEFIRSLNPAADFHFVVIDNGLTGPQGKGIEGKLDATVIPGVAQSEDKPKACRGSYQHAEALNAYLSEHAFSSRYLLVLDPDLYIVAPDWIRKVTTHMQTEGLAFFGTPWHPKWYSKYRNFPSVHCMFIDLSLVDAKDLDFIPDLISRNEAVERRKARGQQQNARKVATLSVVDSSGQTQARPEIDLKRHQWWTLLWHRFEFSTQALAAAYRESRTPLPRSFKLILRLTQLRRKLKYLLGALISLTINRRFIKASNDTGYRIERRFARSGLGVGLLQPVVNYHDDFSTARHLRFWPGRLIESLLPDRWRYVPKRPGYFVEKGFSYYGLPDVTRHKWEEFIWKDAPFAFHLRRYNKTQRDLAMEIEEIERVTAAALQTSHQQIDERPADDNSTLTGIEEVPQYR